MGKALKSDGNYSGMTDEGVYGGCHGWSAINWGGECGNGFIHETGHSYNMAHFTSGTAQSWGISDEYPQDGVNLPSHPAGFHTAFRKFRSWYQVDANDPKKDGNGQLKGKRDPMNGGDSAYSGKYCFPQFTAYHSMKAQKFLESLHVLKETSDGAGLFRWDSATGEYVESTSSFIASVNLPYNDDTHTPSNIKLYKAARGYPEIRLKDSVLLDERTVDYLAQTPQARTVGGPYDGQLSANLLSLCSFACEDSDQTIRVTYSYEKGSTVFLPLSGKTDVLSQIHWTGEEGETLLDLRAHNESGNAITLKAKAIREITLANGEKKTLPINDATEFPDQLEEAFVLWAPSGLNLEINQTSQLITSYWRENAFSAYHLINRTPVEEKEIDVRLDLWTTPAINADLAESDYIGLGYHELYPDKLSGTTLYYVTNNPKVGPVSGVWSGGPSYINISVPMVHEGTDETHQISLRAQRRSHPYEGYWYAMNDAMWIGGSGGNAYPNHLRLSFHETDNPSLPSGRYHTTPENYLYIEGRAWHANHQLLGKHLFNLSVTAP